MKSPSLSSDISINVQALLETRLLVQSNSGGGKSYALRRLLEQTAPIVQQFIIDPEGEFQTLREKYDYVICAPHDADAAATPGTASLLARRLLETKVSAILDIYDLKAHERQLFVRRFLETLINAPKSLWRPVLVVLDEAHVFAPQAGGAEAMGAVIDVATRGRKRGFSLCVATQRLSKLHKDVAAEMLNKLIGRTGLDVDVKRAADELGMSSKAAVESLRNLDPGEFYVFGPALSRTVQKTKIGPVITTHPKSGHRTLEAPPAPSEKVKAKLKELADLPAKAEEEARTLESLQRDNASLRRELTGERKKAAEGGIPEREVQRRIQAAVGEALKSAPREPSGAAKVLQQIAVLAQKGMNGHLQPFFSPADASKALKKIATAAVRRFENAPDISEGLSRAQQKILDTLAALEDFGIPSPSRETTAAHAGQSPSSSGYNNNLGFLRSAGLIEYPSSGLVALTEEGALKTRPPGKKLTVEDIQESWIQAVSRPQGEILKALIESYPDSMDRENLAAASGASPSSSGYNNNLGHLRTLGAIDYPASGQVKASKNLFTERPK